MDWWTSQDIDFSIKQTGLKHVYDPDDNYYPAIAYPVELGELKHIFQNGLYMFDLIDKFNKSTYVEDGKTYYLYKFDDEIAGGNASSLEFMWEDI